MLVYTNMDVFMRFVFIVSLPILLFLNYFGKIKQLFTHHLMSVTFSATRYLMILRRAHYFFFPKENPAKWITGNR